MRDEAPRRLTRTETEHVFLHGDTKEICQTLVDIVLSGEDFEWSQNQCLALARHPSSDVRGLVATCFGHLARIHGRLDLFRVRPVLDDLAREPELRGRVEDAWEDIQRYVLGDQERE